MEQSAAAPEILARWQVSANDWQHFVSHDLRTQLKTARTYRKWFFGIIFVSLLSMAFFVLMPYLTSGAWDWSENVYGPVFGIAAVAGIFILLIGAFRLVQRNKIARLKSPTGDVQITLDRVRINGQTWFDWTYEKNGWQLENVSRQTIDKGGGINFEILEFKFFSHNPGGEIEYREKTGRVPVPTGKSAEADRIIQRLEAEKNRFA